MRKFLLLLICSVLFFTPDLDLKAQCQSGYTHKVDKVMIGGYPWEFELCFKCGITTPGEVYFISATPIPQNPPCTVVTLQQALDYAIGQFSNWDYIINILCPTIPQAPPCSNGESDVVTFRYSYCWQMEKILYFGDETIRFESCSDEYFEEQSTYCYNGTSVIKKTTTYTSSGPLDCGLEEWEVSVPDNVGDKSACFIYHSPCNP